MCSSKGERISYSCTSRLRTVSAKRKRILFKDQIISKGDPFLSQPLLQARSITSQITQQSHYDLAFFQKKHFKQHYQKYYSIKAPFQSAKKVDPLKKRAEQIGDKKETQKSLKENEQYKSRKTWQKKWEKENVKMKLLNQHPTAKMSYFFDNSKSDFGWVKWRSWF